MAADFRAYVAPDNPERSAWNGLRRAIAEAYPNDPCMADRICYEDTDGVYRFVSQILCANQRRGRRIEELMNALDEAKDALYRISDRAEDAMNAAADAIGKVGDVSVQEVVQ